MNNPTAQALPDNVTNDLVYHYDLYERLKGDGDFQGYFGHLHEKGYPDIFWTTANGGHWVVTRGSLLNEILTQPDLFSSTVATVPRDRGYGTAPFPISLDPPEHTQYRKILNGAFSPRIVQPLGEQAYGLTEELIDSFYHRGGCEFMNDVARRLPIGIFMRMMNLPDDDRETLLEIVDEAIRPTNVESNDAGYALSEYARQFVLNRKANLGDDLMSKFIQSETEDGKKMNDDQLTGLAILLLLGGLDTVASVLGFTMNFLARNPDKCQQLAGNPALIPNAVEEVLRRFPVSTLGRIVTRDAAFHGVQLKKDDMVIIPTMAHGMDDREFSNPLEVDFSRKVTFHGAFGNGPHRCLGSMLARVEIRAFLEVWLKRIPSFNLKPAANLTVETGHVVQLHNLPLIWDVT